MTPSTKSRASGAIWGACVGDALGGPVQFMDKGTFERVTGLQYVMPFHKPAGSYSDDGAMTLALAQSFINPERAYDHVASIRNFLDWQFHGRFSTSTHAWDVGMSTRESLYIWKRCIPEHSVPGEVSTSDIQATQRKIDQALKFEKCSGNGSLMRISPVGLMLWREPEAAKQVAREQSRITHPATACMDACALYTELICRIMKGETKPELAQAVARFEISHNTLAERLSRYNGLSDWQEQTDDNIHSSGWVIDTLEVALWAFFKYDDWAEGILAVVNLGGDSDTAGAVHGALAGAFLGFDAIPTEWVQGMQNRGLIEQVADDLSNLVAGSS